MAGATTPDNIPYLTIIDNVIDTGYTAGLATAVQNALDGRALHTYRWANAAARAAQAGMQSGDMGYQVDTRTHYQYTGSAWIVVPVGFQVPTSVSVGSGSSSIGADGVVSFTGASSVSINGVFDGGGLDAYDISITLEHSASGTVAIVLRSSGSNIVSGYDYILNVTQLAAGPTRSSSTTGTQFGFLRSSGAGTTATISARFTITEPAISGATSVILSGTSDAIFGGDRWKVDQFGAHSRAAVYDGFSIMASAGTMTGRLQVRKP